MDPISWSQLNDNAASAVVSSSSDPPHGFSGTASGSNVAGSTLLLGEKVDERAAHIKTFTNRMISDTPSAPEAGRIPRRNLSEAFEELYVGPESPDSASTGIPGMNLPSDNSVKKSNNLISPTGVAEVQHLQEATLEGGKTSTSPHFYLHPELKRDLSQAVVDRVSVYGVIHDINKEANAMAANDDSPFSRAISATENNVFSEECSPLVEALKGPPSERPSFSSMIQAACIDEEVWLLSAIEMRDIGENRCVQACPPTFLQAMGEREYENPLISLSNGSRTQLWKPSRSWWEAKSGKNPWIEPKSHNKRWRYLWPLIHYHKFLAKCIKKLKRNQIDVKMSVSPVAAFLREEVCAVSDHLASVSLFDSEEWMACLAHFSGWTDTRPEAEANLRTLVSKLKLRPLAEYGDVESPLLRSQIDEQFLKTMAEQRQQMELSSAEQQDRRKLNKTDSNIKSRARNPQSDPMARHLQSPHEASNQGAANGHLPRGSGLRRQRMVYPYHPQWWGHGWLQLQAHQYAFGADGASTHSAVSDGTFPAYGMYTPGMGPDTQFYHPQPAAFVPPEHPHGPAFHPNVSPDANIYPVPYHPDHPGLGFFGHPPVDPSMAYAMHQQQQEAAAVPYKENASSPQNSPSSCEHHQEERDAADQTPYKYNPSKTPRSPYWGHLDTTIAMGLSTPQTNTKLKHHHCEIASPADTSDAMCVAGNAQPLLLRQSQYYGYGPVSNYAPPSPATQFMMSPQANFAYNYGYGYSPSHAHIPPQTSYKQSPLPPGDSSKLSSSLREASPGLSSMNRIKATQCPATIERESPATVDTITESESCSEAA